MKIKNFTQYNLFQTVRSNASLTVQVSRGFITTSFKSDFLRKLSDFDSRF